MFARRFNSTAKQADKARKSQGKKIRSCPGRSSGYCGEPPLDGVHGIAQFTFECNSQYKPDTFLDRLPIKIPLKMQRGVMPHC